MATKTGTKRDEAWIGNEAGGDEFNGGKMWIGRHTADGDILVFDPETCDPAAAHVTLFSLAQLRTKVFPRAVVAARIEEVTDPAEQARVQEEYRRWPTLREERERERVTAREEAVQRQRDATIERHRGYLEDRGIGYEGVHDTATGKRAGATRRRRTKCHACGIALDDFAAAECMVCNGVLCSCGACGCGAPVRER